MRRLLPSGVAFEIIEDGLLLRRLQGRQTSLVDLFFHLRNLDFPHRRRHRARIVGLMALATSPQVKLAGIAVLLWQRLLASGKREKHESRECDADSRGG